MQLNIGLGEGVLLLGLGFGCGFGCGVYVCISYDVGNWRGKGRDDDGVCIAGWLEVGWYVCLLADVFFFFVLLLEKKG
jgi:hypothetical protein